MVDFLEGSEIENCVFENGSFTKIDFESTKLIENTYKKIDVEDIKGDYASFDDASKKTFFPAEFPVTIRAKSRSRKSSSS